MKFKKYPQGLKKPTEKGFKSRINVLKREEIDLNTAVEYGRNLSRLSGLMIYNVKVLPNDEIKVQLSWSGLLACITWISLFIWCNYYTFANQQTILGVLYESMLKQYGEYAEAALVCTTVLYICYSLCRCSCHQFWSKIYKIDSQIREIGVNTDCSKLKLKIQLAIISNFAAALFLALSLYYVLSSLDVNMPFCKMFQVGFSFNTILHCQFQFYFCALIIETRFGYLNKGLESVLHATRSVSVLHHRFVGDAQLYRKFSYKEAKMLDKIDSVSNIYSQLYSITLEMENIFGNFVVLMLCFGFESLILHTFYMMEAIARGLQYDSNIFLLFVVYNGEFIAFAIFVIYYTVEASERVYKEKFKIVEIVNNIIQEEVSDEVIEAASQFSLQLLHRQQKFTANGLFCIDRSLLLSVAGSVSTFLVILLQFATDKNATDFKDIAGTPVAVSNDTLQQN